MTTQTAVAVAGGTGGTGASGQAGKRASGERASSRGVGRGGRERGTGRGQQRWWRRFGFGFGFGRGFEERERESGSARDVDRYRYRLLFMFMFMFMFIFMFIFMSIMEGWICTNVYIKCCRLSAVYCPVSSVRAQRKSKAHLPAWLSTCPMSICLPACLPPASLHCLALQSQSLRNRKPPEAKSARACGPLSTPSTNSLKKSPEPPPTREGPREKATFHSNGNGS